MKSRLFSGIVSVFLFLALLMATAHAQQSGIVPVTTKSAAAKALYEGALVKMENLHDDPALQDLRQAVKLDPDFALAHLMISFPSVSANVDPQEQVAARDHARAARAKVSHGEQLMIDWFVATSEGRMVPAIQAMNEALEEFPGDKHLAWMAGVWMENQQQNRRAIPLFERAIHLDPGFAAPLNEAAYCYAHERSFDKAMELMKRYTELLPGEPNPQDSYAEILRMGGKFEDAIAHYRMSLKLDPSFVESELGIADTYALMGEESRARAEYAIAIKGANSKSQAANWSLNAAVSYVRENNFTAADAAFSAVAAQAHKDDLAVPEAEAYRMMSAYKTDSVAALQLLRKAEAVLQEKHPLPVSARQEELALIWRERVYRQVRDGNLAAARATVSQLEEMAGSSQDQLIEIDHVGATGALRVAEGRYEEALSYLEQDDHNPISVKLMFTANQKMGHKDEAAELSKILANWNEPTLEQSLVVPEFRPKETAGTVGASFRRM